MPAQLVMRLLNLIEDLGADLRDAQIEIQRLRDAVNRLKGPSSSSGQGKPNVKANTPESCRTNRPRMKRNKKAAIRIDREQALITYPQFIEKIHSSLNYGADPLDD